MPEDNARRGDMQFTNPNEPSKEIQIPSGARQRSIARRRSADLQSAVSQICNLQAAPIQSGVGQTLGLRTEDRGKFLRQAEGGPSADCKSALRPAAPPIVNHISNMKPKYHLLFLLCA